MTKEECAAAVDKKSFAEVMSLPDEFLEQMKASGLFLCFTPDDESFHAVGASEAIVRFYWDHPSHFNIIAYREKNDDNVYFDTDRHGIEFVGNEVIIGGDDPEGDLILIEEAEILPGRAGYRFAGQMENAPVIIYDRNYICQGLVFSKDDVK